MRITIKQIIHALEASAPNTNDSPRWLAATALRNITQWETATIEINERERDHAIEILKICASADSLVYVNRRAAQALAEIKESRK